MLLNLKRSWHTSYINLNFKNLSTTRRQKPMKIKLHGKLDFVYLIKSFANRIRETMQSSSRLFDWLWSPRSGKRELIYSVPRVCVCLFHMRYTVFVFAVPLAVMSVLKGCGSSILFIFRSLVVSLELWLRNHKGKSNLKPIFSCKY